MSGTLILTLLVGLAGVLQGGLNREISASWGLPSTLFLNAVVFLVAATVFLTLGRYTHSVLPESLAEKNGFETFAWWYIFPGLLGFLFVLGIPFAIARIGALKVFVGIVSAQMLSSLVWDMWVESIPLTLTRFFGALCAVASVALISWQK